MTLLPIGRFAKASRISVKSLRNYDESGLLKAAFVDPSSGYRYYRIEQLARATTIRSLRLVEMPLAMIEMLLDQQSSTTSPNSPNGSDVLHSYLAELTDELARHEKRIHDLQRIISSQELIMSNTVTVKTIEPQHVAAFRITTTHDSVFADIPAGFAKVFGSLAEVDAAPSGIPFALFHEFPDADSSGEISLCVPVSADTVLTTDLVTTFELPGGAAASVVHRGSYESMDSAYASVAAWIHERGHRGVAPSREIYLNSPVDTAEGDLLTEIQWPIDA